MDTIIVMGSANIRHNNENEKRFFFWLFFFFLLGFLCMKQKDLLICQELLCLKLNKNVPYLLYY